MGLSKWKLGDLLTRNSETNQNNQYGIADVRGLLNTKEISANTKADIDGRDLSKFLVVRPGGFVFNHRVHDKLGLGYNISDNVYIFTNDYVAFYVKPEVKKHILLPDYLYIWYLRSEFDRYMLYKTYGSATLFFSWDNMCDLEITLPPLSIQQKYVDVYNAMLANQQSYERGLEDLKLTCDAYIEELRKKSSCEAIGKYIAPTNESNASGLYTHVQGVESSGSFMDTKANMQDVDIKKYTIVRKNDFVFNPSRINIGSIAIYTDDNPCIVSPMYSSFRIIDKDKLMPFYLMLWLSRKEFQRYTWFYAAGSVRDTFDYSLMSEVKIPIPPIEIQQDIVNIYEAYLTRKEINEQLKAQIKDICPILIKGSIEEAQA